jgi:putative hemolysin
MKEKNATKFRLIDFKAKGLLGKVIKAVGPLGDRLLALDRLEALYRQNGLEGLDVDGFLDELLDVLKVEVEFDKKEIEHIPARGPVIVVANHPFGGIEGIVLAAFLRRVRPDVKILANSMLRLVTELRDLFMFINPLVKNHPENIGALRRSIGWVKNGGLLVVFPAGRVSYYRKERRKVTDGTWSRIAASMVRITGAKVVPVFFPGQNSRLFLSLGRIYYRLRLLMLPREFLKSAGKHITLRVGQPVPNSIFKLGEDEKATEYLRMRTYLLEREPRKDTDTGPRQPLVSPVPGLLLEKEIGDLPPDHHLVDKSGYTVFYGYQYQLPETVKEIGRLRELTFRDLGEGSGKSCDIDSFDSDYAHLFIWDGKEKQIVGAYRMGQSDRILRERGPEGLYLSRMFRFSGQFLEHIHGGLEMGRSWIRRDHQQGFLGLYLLWRGIGEFVLRNPHYHTLYGTVSLSTLYHPFSLALMIRSLLTGTAGVEPISSYSPALPAEVELYLQKYPLSVEELAELVGSIEGNGTGIPVLVRHYLKVGAVLHSVALDRGFSDTPGVLLTVDLRSTSKRALQMFLGDGYSSYLQQHGISV